MVTVEEASARATQYAREVLGAALPLEYKAFLVDAMSGEPIAMKLAS
jgi:hypothetical protein